jgi:FixJ family two-component response regulator
MVKKVDKKIEKDSYMTLYSEFSKKYGKRTASVVRAIVNGWSNKRIASQFKISNMSVAAYRANITRGAYYPYVDVGAEGIFFA